MTKSDLIEQVATQLNLPKGKAELIINCIFDSMEESLRDGHRIEIRGFGSFEIRRYKAYEGRNPRTGDPVGVHPKRLPFFKVGKELKERVNAGGAEVRVVPVAAPAAPAAKDAKAVAAAVKAAPATAKAAPVVAKAAPAAPAPAPVAAKAAPVATKAAPVVVKAAPAAPAAPAPVAVKAAPAAPAVAPAAAVRPAAVVAAPVVAAPAPAVAATPAVVKPKKKSDAKPKV